MKYQVVLFDADGTLFDFSRAEAYALEEAFRELGLGYRADYLNDYSIINHEAWRSFERGEITSEELRILRFSRFCDKLGIQADPENLSRAYLSWLARAEFLLEGAKELVEALAGKIRLAIVTNGLKDVQRGRFGRSPIHKHFDEIVISEEVGMQKPDPAIFEHTLRSLGHADKSSVLMVGDSLTSDIQGGLNFGIDTCWYNPGHADVPKSPTPRYVVDALDQLLSICLPRNGGGEPQG